MNREQSIISALAGFIVLIASLFGVAVDLNTVSVILCFAAAIGAWGWNMVMNHNFSEAANRAQRFLNTIRNDDSVVEDDF